MNSEQRAAYKMLQDAGGKLIRHTGGHGIWKVKGRTFALPHHTTAWKGNRAVMYAMKTRVFLKRLERGSI